MTNAPAAPSPRPAFWNPAPVEGVRRVVAVASGKGGVGKSTTAVNLALALSHLGARVGLLDADIYGPSIPQMMGVAGRPEMREGKMLPHLAHGIECMSIGFLTDEAAILRGPMITKALHQMLRGVAWGISSLRRGEVGRGANTPNSYQPATDNAPSLPLPLRGRELDFLLVDMPPGTGDIHLSMAQSTPLAGAVIVTTPQEVATIDARKCLTMFRKVNVPVWGVIENMSAYVDASGARIPLFGEGGGKKLAEETGVPFLGEVPLYMEVREAADAGAPLVTTHPNHPSVKTYAAIALKIMERAHH